MGTPRFISLPREFRNAIYAFLIPDGSFVQLVPDQPWECRGVNKDAINTPDRLCIAHRKPRLQKHASPEIKQHFQECEVCTRTHAKWACIDRATLDQQRRSLLNIISLATTCQQVHGEVFHEFVLRVDFHVAFDLQTIQHSPMRFSRVRRPLLGWPNQLATYQHLASGVLPRIKRLTTSVGLNQHEQVDSGLRRTSLVHVELELLLHTEFIARFTSLRQLTILRPDLPSTHYRDNEQFLNRRILPKVLDKFQTGTLRHAAIPPDATIFAAKSKHTSPEITPLEHLQELDERLISLFPGVDTKICGLRSDLPLDSCPDRAELTLIWVSSNLWSSTPHNQRTRITAFSHIYKKYIPHLKWIEALLLRNDVDTFMEPMNEKYRLRYGSGTR